MPDRYATDLPPAVERELRRSSPAGVAGDVAKALALGADAIDDGDGARAVGFLEWAKSIAPRAPSIREALGVARYLAGDYAAALSELQAYRRLTGLSDQNHVVADCMRALGRPPGRIAELVAEMDPDRDGPDRVAEGVIVWASALADADHPDAGRAVLRRVLQPPGPIRAAHDVRLWYVAGDLAARAGDVEDARRWFGAVAEAGGDPYDVEERLAALEDG